MSRSQEDGRARRTPPLRDQRFNSPSACTARSADGACRHEARRRPDGLRSPRSVPPRAASARHLSLATADGLRAGDARPCLAEVLPRTDGDRTRSARRRGGHLLDDVDVDPDDVGLVRRVAAERVDEGDVFGSATDLDHLWSPVVVAGQVQRGTSRSGCSWSSVEAWEFCTATREPNSTCSATAWRKAGSVDMSAASSARR